MDSKPENVVLGTRNGVGKFTHSTETKKPISGDGSYAYEKLDTEWVTVQVYNPNTGKYDDKQVEVYKLTPGQYMDDEYNVRAKKPIESDYSTDAQYQDALSVYNKVADYYKNDKTRQSYYVSGATAVGVDNVAEGNHSTAIGNKAKVLNSVGSFYIDKDQKLTRDSDAAYYFLKDGQITTEPQYVKNPDGSYYRDQKGYYVKTSFLTVDRLIDSSDAVAIGSDVTAEGRSAVAIGHQSYAKEYSVAIGENSVTDYMGVAIGKDNKAKYASTAIGHTNDANGYYTATMGVNNTARADESTAIGYGNSVDGQQNGGTTPKAAYTHVLGSNNTVKGNYNAVFGDTNTVTGAYALALGDHNKISGENTVGADGDYGIAIGYGNTVEKNALALGLKSNSIHDGSIAIGNQVNTTGDNNNGATDSIAIGTKASVHMKNGIVLGNEAYAGNNGDNSEGAIAIGHQAKSAAGESIAIGTQATTGNNVGSTGMTNIGAIAIGSNSTADTVYDIAMGWGANTKNTANGGAIALGHNATIEQGGQASAAIGDSARVKENIHDAVALGSQAYADRAANNQGGYDPASNSKDHNAGSDPAWNSTLAAVSVGKVAWTEWDQTNQKNIEHTQLTRQITNVAAGKEDTDAVNVAQLKQVVNLVHNSGGSGTGGSGVHDYSVKSVNPGTDNNYNNGGASGDNALAAGVNASATGAHSVAVGNGATAKGQDSIALGTGAVADGIGATAIGQYNTASGQNSLAFGGGYNKGQKGNTASGVASVAFGERTEASGESATAFGSDSTASGKNAAAFGENSTASGEASTAFGIGSTAAAKNSLAALGGTVAESAENAVAIGNGAQANLADSVALGSGSVTTRAKYSDLTDEEKKAVYIKGDSTGSAWEATDNAIAVGNDSKVTRQITGVAAGSLDTDAVNVAQLKKVQNLAGKHTKVTVEGGTDAGTTAKDGTRTYTGTNLKLNQLTDENGATVYDLKLADAVTIGGKDGADGTNGVDGHIGVRGNDGEKGANGRDAVSIDGKDGNEGHIGLKGKDGEKGKDGQNAYSDITTHFGPATLNPDKNVKIIKDDGETDAATRLHYVDQNHKEHEVATMDDGLTFVGDDGQQIKKYLNEELTIKGGAKTADKDGHSLLTDGNIGVVKDNDGNMVVKLAKDVKDLSSITIKNTATTQGTTDVTIDGTGIHAGGKKVTNVGAGEISDTSTDAVNGSQLNKVKTLAGQHTTVEAGSKNVSVMESTNDAGGKKYTVDLAKDVTFGDAAKGDKTVAISGTDGTITAGTGDNKVTVDGSKGQIVAGGNNGVKIGNIENGDSSLTIYDKDGKATGKTDKAGKYVTNLDNKTWNTDGSYVSGRAATEDQLHQVESNVNKKFDDVNTKIESVDKHHTEVTVNGGTAAKADGSYTDGNLQIAQKTGSDGHQKIYDLKLSDNLNIGGAGKDGAPGKDGHMGINGADGKSGVGIDGKDGISIKGKDGQNGVTIKGVDGKDGTEGHIGLTGPKGADGQNATADIYVKNGQNGVDGTDGHGGKAGMDRVVYEDHNHITHEVATMDDGMKYSGDSGNAAVKLNKNVQIYGGATEYADGNNIGVVASQDGDNAKLQVKLAKDLKGINSIEAKTITTGNTTINNSGLTVKGDDNHKDITIQQGNVNMGGNTIEGVAPGAVTPDSTDAVNGSQLYAAGQAISNLGGAVNKLGTRVDRVGAGAAALAALHPLDFDPDDKWDFAAGYGNYRGANAAAVGAYYRPNEDTMFSISGSFGGGENMVNAGVSFKLGQGNHVSTSRVAMAKEIKDLRENVAQLNQIVNRQSALIEKLTSVDTGSIQDKGNDLFPDVPENHWAYEYVTKLAKAGILKGYPDGKFAGDRMMTRYEFAAIVYRAITMGAASDPGLNQDGTLGKLAKEFNQELKFIRIDTIHQTDQGEPTVQRVRVQNTTK